MSNFLKQNKTYLKSTFYKSFSSIFSSKVFNISKRDFTTSIENETFVLYSKFINDIYGKEIQEKTTYDLLDPNFRPKSKEEQFYFVNRENSIDGIYKQLEVNLNGRLNKMAVKHRVGLINLGDNNGTGKTRMLGVLPLIIQSIEIFGESEKIFYPNIVEVEFKNSVIETFIYSILKSLKPIFNNSPINVEIKYSSEVLDDLSINITKYLSSDKNESIEAWEQILNAYYIPRLKKPCYIEPKGKVIIFRLDEIGKISLGKNVNEFTNEENSMNEDFDFPLKHKLRKFILRKMLRLYLLRNYIESFCNSSIEVIVAGKNGFLPFMGNLNFNTSPSMIKTFSLAPINHQSNLENIFKYHIIFGKKKIFKTLLNLKRSMNKYELNKKVRDFIEYLIDYSGGHPRLIYKILDLIDNENELDKYFNSNSAANESFEKLFKRIEDELFKIENNDVLQRMTKTSMMDVIVDLIDEESEYYKILKKDPLDFYLLMMYKLHNYNQQVQSNNGKVDKFYLQLIMQYLPHEFTKILDESDIAIALGTPYLTISNGEIKFIIPKFLRNFLLKSLITQDESSLREKLKMYMCNVYRIEPKTIELMVIDYYHLCFINNFKDYFSIFVNNNNNNSESKYEINRVEIDGCKIPEEYSKVIANQILEIVKNDICSYIITPKMPNNVAHDFYVILPTFDNQLSITAVQVKTENSEIDTLNMTSEKIEQGITLIKEIYEFLKDKRDETESYRYPSEYSLDNIESYKFMSEDNRGKRAKIKPYKYLLISNCQKFKGYNPNPNQKSHFAFLQNLLMKDLIDMNKNSKNTILKVDKRI